LVQYFLSILIIQGCPLPDLVGLAGIPLLCHLNPVLGVQERDRKEKAKQRNSGLDFSVL
jgi:hypothetical protein